MRVFIAGPYGDHNTPETIAANVARADAVARDLMAAGHQVYVPHKMSWGWERDSRLTRAQFIALDNSYLELWAEAIVRIPGHSPGADAEMEYAARLGLTVLPFPRKAGDAP